MWCCYCVGLLSFCHSAGFSLQSLSVVCNSGAWASVQHVDSVAPELEHRLNVRGICGCSVARGILQAGCQTMSLLLAGGFLTTWGSPRTFHFEHQNISLHCSFCLVTSLSLRAVTALPLCWPFLIFFFRASYKWNHSQCEPSWRLVSFTHSPSVSEILQIHFLTSLFPLNCGARPTLDTFTSLRNIAWWRSGSISSLEPLCIEYFCFGYPKLSCADIKIFNWFLTGSAQKWCLKLHWCCPWFSL